jgi:alpha-beta hydrolase superfamily lysophospholipase
MNASRRRFLTLGAAAAAGGCATLDSKQSEWIFRPVRDNWRGYQGLPPGTEEVWLDVPGRRGERVHGWWALQPDADAPALLYLHGARWNLTGSSFRIERWREMGFSVLAIDYRGFGQSSGELPSEAQAYEDARLAWDWLKAREARGARRFIYGHSLGGAVAIDLASRLQRGEAAGLITEAAFTSVPDVVAASRYGWLPVGFLITQRFEAIEKIGKAALPVLLLHGTGDVVVPHTMGDALFAAAREPKRLVKFDGASHSGIAWASAEKYRQVVTDFVRQVSGSQAPSHASR